MPIRSLCFLASWAIVATSQYDNARTGANLDESSLTPANVNARAFGKLCSLAVDGAIYAQPLYLPNVNVPSKGVHDVVFVATEHNSVYAFDARGQPPAPLWHVSFINPAAGITPVPARDVHCPFIVPEIGITSTPVIDVNTGTLYVLARSKEARGWLSSDAYTQKLHALAITTGAEKFGGPVAITAAVPGRGAGASGGMVVFNPLRDNPRAALLLANGRVYLTWASSCDVGPYHGWVMAYDATTLKQVAVFNTSPDNEESGIWHADTGPAADASGNVFVVTGNGRFTVNAGGRDYGDSVLKLRPDPRQLSLIDFFTPYNERDLNRRDDDLGSGGPVLVPDGTRTGKHLLLVGGKGGTLYVLDPERMGRHHQGDDSHALQSVLLPGPIFGAPAYWNGRVYVIAGTDVPRVFDVRGRELNPLTPGRGFNYPDGGATPTVSANGMKNGIVWAIATNGWRRPERPAVLHAYDALNLAAELYNSEQNAGRDRAGRSLRFTIPTVAGGRVYVGTRGRLDIYGLLP